MTTRSECKARIHHLVANVLRLGDDHDLERILKSDRKITSILTLLNISAEDLRNMKCKSADGKEDLYLTASEMS